MNTTSLRGMHPLIMVAAAAVILTCLLAIGVMTGIVPSPMSNRADKQELTGAAPSLTGATTSSTTTTLASPSGTTTRETRTVTRAPAHEPRRLTSAPPAAATGATSSSTSSTVGGASPAPAPSVAACANCGTVTSVRAIKEQGTASMIGPAAGALIGGLAGRQIGGGTGRTIATVVGAGVGAGAGTEVERRYKSTTQYVVDVRMQDGSNRSVTYATAPNVAAGSRVKVVDGQLVHN